MPDPASWNLLDEDCSSVAAWDDLDTDTAVSEVSPAGQFRMDTNAGAAGDAIARRSIDIGSIPNEFTAEIKCYCDAIGTYDNNDHAQLTIRQADEIFWVDFGSDGLFLHDTDSGRTEAGTTLVKQDGSAEWQTWRFLVTFTDTTGNGTCDVYLKDSTHNWSKVGTSLPCSWEGTFVDGVVTVAQKGWITDDRVEHIDYIKIATGLYIPGIKTNLFDGKVCISPSTLIFDGKTRVKNFATGQFDGKSVVALVSEDKFDGKLRIKDVTTVNFDGKTAVKNIATSQFDGKVWLYPARDFFDGKIWIKELIEGSVDLPSLGITGNTGGIGDITLPFFEVLGEVSVGIDAQGSLTLPGLGVAGFTGAKCSYNLPSLGVSGTSVVGVAASGDVVLPIFGIDGQSFTDALVHGVFTLPALNVVASSIAGTLCIGEVTLPRLGVSATAKIGTICTGAVTLPCLIVEGDSGHIPVGNGDVTLPLLKIYSTASRLADPRDGCHVLRYNRWR
jgi:hypothetical protein